MKKIQSIKNKINWVIFVLFIALSFSCKKLIQIPVHNANQIPITQVFADSASTLAYVKGIYNNFNVNVGGTLTSGLLDIIPGRTADELSYIGAGDEDQNTILVSNPDMETFWSNAYTNMYQINSCLENIPSSTVLSQPLKKQLLGEIKVIRAFYYFNLVNLFGGVPLVTTTDYHLTESLPRASVDSVYSLIISDLTSSQKLLTATYPQFTTTQRARVNLYVADALLAKVYLYRQQWALAASTSSVVINSGIYSLVSLNNVFLDGSNEAIWQLPATGLYTQTYDGSAFTPYPNSIPAYQIAPALSNAFEAGDLRKTDWVGTNPVNDGVTTTLYYYPAKYKNNTAAATPAEDLMFLRLSEQYLIRAEAYAHSGNAPGAVADINQIRNPARVGLPNYTGPTDQTSLLNEIMHERQVELFCEWGNRWFDLKRTGTINNVLGAEKPGFQPFAALYPIPLTEIQNNPFLLQNPGYPGAK
ncbi:RagB/SusD family nutrient uptake outer membrane protein [Mucilaginibacter polytrichastri]|uniref:RagB/SusD domain-containing protein n=1 Tax=Mucilaginibacter polytrichastri TaxID=1302689 RepID=A0A1Q6A427_9SPHI|nr:RagB/SusD family nutrient uptake outer membrane protein [Mucilaginibacter polytrichastri]OKS88769.1 hypothetical protein RG47T_4247 [Mucilaginibacter polytrichastri]SFT05442.1 Starch-binding associating with outer membrane [Mucilaginibacter polytrichastri]